jgi:hypothetical protein
VTLNTEEQDVLNRVREVQQHGYGQVLIIIQDHQLIQINWQKTQLRVSQKKR